MMITLRQPHGPAWARFVELYRESFPAWEREPPERLAARIASGRYRLVVLPGADGRIIGFHVTDVVVTLGYAVLTFVAVSPAYRAGGLGTRLVEDAVARFRSGGHAQWLFVEAEAAPARLYRRCGFRRLALDYRVPHYDCKRAVQPMSLLVIGCGAHAGALDGTLMRRVVGHMLRDGYRLPEADKRLQAQLARIPERVETEPC